MSERVAELLDAFDGFSDEEKRLFTVEFLRRLVPFDSGPFEDDEATQASDDLFAMID